MVRAVNRGAGQTGFAIIGLSCAKELPKLLELYAEEGLHSEVAYWNNVTSKSSGSYDKFVIMLYSCIDQVYTHLIYVHVFLLI